MRPFLLLCLAVPLAAFWFQDAAGPTVRVTSRLVPIDVLVTDKSTGMRVDGLNADRFRILEDGRNQAIAQFSRGSQGRPLAVAIVVETARDTTAKTLPLLAATMSPAFGHLRPEDELMVVRMSPGAEIVQDLTADRNAATHAIEGLAEEQRNAKTFAGVHDLTDDLHKALLLAARHLQRSRPDARAAIVVIGSDWNFTPVPAMDQTAMQLIAAGASVHGLIRVDSKVASTFKGIYGMLPKNTYRDQNIVWYSEQTGGEAIKMKDSDFGAAFEKVIAGIAASYSVAFVPNSDLFDDTFHKLSVEMQGPGAANLIVRARSRYYASIEQPVAPDSSLAGELSDISPEPGVFCQIGGQYTRLAEATAPRVKLTDRHGPAIAAAFRLALIQIYSGPKASLQLSNARPTFLLRSRREPSFARLARLQPMKDERWLRVSLFLDKNRATPSLVISKTGAGLYRITPTADLTPGQYVLSLNAWASPIYDFGIVHNPAQ